VWDLAIQSNISDMDETSKRAIDAIEHCDASIRHGGREFPNNRFVARQYARFVSELLADHALAAEMAEKSRLLIRDIRVNKERAHEWGVQAFPNLPWMSLLRVKHHTATAMFNSRVWSMMKQC
jgi:hypothetical protein